MSFLVFPKEDIKNVFGNVIFQKDKGYRCSPMEYVAGEEPIERDYVVECELIGAEYPIMSMLLIKEKFYTIEDLRDNKIENLLN